MSAFRVENGRLLDPDGNPFLTLGVNHADETNLKYPRNVDVWRLKYGSRASWIPLRFGNPMSMMIRSGRRSSASSSPASPSVAVRTTYPLSDNVRWSTSRTSFRSSMTRIVAEPDSVRSMRRT